MAQAFKTGDSVQLKSGGPTMTVKGYTQELAAEDRELRLRCQWFAGKKLEEGIFPEKSLNAVEAK